MGTSCSIETSGKGAREYLEKELTSPICKWLFEVVGGAEIRQPRARAQGKEAAETAVVWEKLRLLGGMGSSCAPWLLSVKHKSPPSPSASTGTPIRSCSRWMPPALCWSETCSKTQEINRLFLASLTLTMLLNCSSSLAVFLTIFVIFKIDAAAESCLTWLSLRSLLSV